MVFNSYNAIGRWGGTHFAVRPAGVKNAPLRWALGSAKKLTAWDTRIEIVDEWPLFSRVPRDPLWKKKTIRFMDFSDRFRMQSMVHLRFK